ncbi:unnamed protein product [Lepidochelys olivacea]
MAALARSNRRGGSAQGALSSSTRDLLPPRKVQLQSESLCPVERGPHGQGAGPGGAGLLWAVRDQGQAQGFAALPSAVTLLQASQQLVFVSWSQLITTKSPLSFKTTKNFLQGNRSTTDDVVIKVCFGI